MKLAQFVELSSRDGESKFLINLDHVLKIRVGRMGETMVELVEGGSFIVAEDYETVKMITT